MKIQMDQSEVIKLFYATFKLSPELTDNSLTPKQTMMVEFSDERTAHDGD